MFNLRICSPLNVRTHSIQHIFVNALGIIEQFCLLILVLLKPVREGRELLKSVPHPILHLEIYVRSGINAALGGCHWQFQRVVASKMYDAGYRDELIMVTRHISLAPSSKTGLVAVQYHSVITCHCPPGFIVGTLGFTFMFQFVLVN